MSVETASAIGTILVVDDNPTNIQVLFDVLSEIGYRVAIAKSGEAALQRLQSYHPDLILLDVMMPGIDGFETCGRLKSDRTTSDIPVIFMTALSDSVDKVKGLSLGAVDYITKPVQHEEALARIRVHMKLRDAQKKVEQKTIELSQALNDLKQAQVHLVQSEKMSSLGQLVAGVAHEINNPLNFVSANIQPAKDHIQDLMTFLELYEECHPQPHPKIKAWMDDVDVDYLQEDLPKLLNSMQLGSDRIYQLVLSLRNFSRLDEAQVKPVDIHEGIDSTLVILQHRLKACAEHPTIQVIKDYGQLPMVECYPSQLNQVFMNLLSNAIDALEEGIRNTPARHNPTIAIHTFTADTNSVTIAISDNGTGICSEVRSQLFDPFFTTKSVGKGTGLGLSISHQIVTERHRGKIDCYSKLGQGSEFVVQIPVRQRIPQVPEGNLDFDGMEIAIG
ncbi:MAG: hybrid sensor histidine kinase/response regulator [Microcoleus sp. PH2017_22_RUC_O_B]|uniref:sensor histidine kinase n=1 Tax=unclassified Microcoleus TaxID=2642155 RepID=UPI001E188EBF|nr:MULTISPECIES: response regulator [unclassified Microcoleus]MCC3529714.1 hybrid sensor histidine kinase/response regulator [Microcoleus sp. PH2017_21_RUC_O_A]MCC3542003.1 hybrid sensor histidine kinase/response regulator [Microcoleus sp. PH2017_22_RUC_O_B]